MEKITHIEKIEIKGFWGKYHIEWHLNPDVNILAGINGSGKTTLLNLIVGVFTDANFVGNVDNWIDVLKISFNDNKRLDFYSNIETIQNNGIGKTPQEQLNSKFQDLLIEKTENDLVKVELIRKKSNESDLKSSEFRFYGFKPNIDYNKIISELISISRISTFEQPIKTQSVTHKLFPELIKTDLDIQIFEIQRAYLSYQINLGKRVEQVFSENSEGAPIDIKTKREEIYGKKELFTQTINQFFSQTGKTVEYDENNEIVFRQNGNILTPYQLSSGEKQVLLILLSTLIQDNKPYILILDEPEISLHIDWQEELIQVIRNLNENVQIILATHSPALVMKGWMDKVTEMEDITKPE